MPNPTCPLCGSPMQLRTARRGPTAGQQFYGCSRYPECKGTVNIQAGSADTSATSNSHTSSARLSLPRVFIARPRSERLQVRFFQSVAVSTSVLENLIESDIPDQELRTFSQWRLDFQTPSQPINWTERHRQAFAVAEKILTRGRLTLCSPSLESAFTKKFTDINQPVVVSKEMLRQPIQHFNAEYWLDSPAERVFYNDYLPNKFGMTFLQWVTPQVELTSLVSANTNLQLSGRVDFLICHPDKQPTIVEIDGERHRQQKDIDRLRDEALSREGFRVIRIPTSEIATLSGPNLSTFEKLFSLENHKPVESVPCNQKLFHYIQAIKISHQIQLSVLEAVKVGLLEITDSSSWNISTNLNATGLYNENDSLFILKTAIEDLIQLLQNIGHLYSTDLCKGIPKLTLGSGSSSGIHLSFTGEPHPFLPTFFIQNISVPFDIANTIFTSSPAILDPPSKEILEYFLNYIFRKPNFREGQVDAISRTLQGKDSIVLLPTGAGKSLAFQLASLLLPGRAIVIDPIISLMEDQIDNLQMVGIDRAIAITSQITDPHDRSLVLSLFGQGEYLFAYIAPERFQTVEFRESLRRLTTHTPISLIAIDEAHCVSEWGHDFRTAYLNIGRTTRTYCESDGITPPILALTGTASRAVLKDVQRELQIEDFDAIITPKSFDRPELKFHILSASSAEKSARLIGYLSQSLPSKFATTPATFFQPKGKSTFSGLIFCPHVNTEFGVVEIADKIKKSIGVATSYYSGKEPKFYTSSSWNSAKQAIARQFKHNQIPLLVCTKAFGMGIDKPNIRYTIHFGIPSSIESFYQEAGRAGRDRETAHCCIIVSVDDPNRARKLLDPNTRPEEIYTLIKSLSWNDNDDVTRALYFLTNAFPGIEAEKSRVAQVIHALQDLSTKRKKSITLHGLERGYAEKALHRLVDLGIVSDYTINYNTEEFNVELAGPSKESVIEAYGNYVAGYLGARRQAELEKASRLLQLPFGDFVLGMVDLLLHFIYDVIERGRRRALYEMFLAATESPNDAAIRQRILRYLEATQYSEALDAILAASDAALDKTMETFEAVRSPNEAAELRGQVARYLESYPDHPGLLMLRSLAEVYSRDRNGTIVRQNFSASISSASEKYAVKKHELFQFIAWAIAKVAHRDVGIAQELQINILRERPERALARKLVEECPLEIASTPAWFLLAMLTERSKELISS